MKQTFTKQITTEILCGIDWLLATATRPTLQNLLGCGEGALERQLYRLEAQKLVEKSKSASGEWIYALTDHGRNSAQVEDDPAGQWNRSWDRTWNLLLFDLAKGNQKERKRLWRRLRSNHFGCLQRSVWISPDLPADIAQHLEKFSDDPNSVVLLEAQQPRGQKLSNRDLAQSAWDFESLQMRYRQHGDLLKTHSLSRPASTLMSWLLEEARAWKQLLRTDPLLPKELYPKSFAGFEVHRKRTQILTQIQKKLKG